MPGRARGTGDWGTAAFSGEALPSAAGDPQETWGRGERRAQCPDVPLMGWE